MNEQGVLARKDKYIQGGCFLFSSLLFFSFFFFSSDFLVFFLSGFVRSVEALPGCCPNQSILPTEQHTRPGSPLSSPGLPSPFTENCCRSLRIRMDGMSILAFVTASFSSYTTLSSIITFCFSISLANHHSRCHYLLAIHSLPCPYMMRSLARSKLATRKEVGKRQKVTRTKLEQHPFPTLSKPWFPSVI
ncbi:hypothetical protein QBC45DRAFT_205729 [Copromyces sp. CBS 386.78]|nr:hypothetical protein QBC45DRAFT_205729 [Copromyces sp. CBS 386.78]